MRAALSDDTPVERSAEQESTVQIVAETWHMAESLRGTLLTSEQEAEIIALDASLKDAKAVVRDLMDRERYRKSYRPWTLWHPTRPQRKPRPRNFIKHPRTATELGNLDAFHVAIGRSWRAMKPSPRAAWRVGMPMVKPISTSWWPLLMVRGTSLRVRTTASL